MLAHDPEVVLLEGDGNGDELRYEKGADEADDYGLAELQPISHVQIEERCEIGERGSKLKHRMSDSSSKRTLETGDLNVAGPIEEARDESTQKPSRVEEQEEQRGFASLPTTRTATEKPKSVSY